MLASFLFNTKMVVWKFWHRILKRKTIIIIIDAKCFFALLLRKVYNGWDKILLSFGLPLFLAAMGLDVVHRSWTGIAAAGCSTRLCNR